MARRVGGLACFAAALLVATGARAAAATYTSRTEFDAAIAALAPHASLDFESLAGDTVIPGGTAVGDFTFHYAIAGGVELVVVDGFATTSGTNSLGTVGDLALLASDAFSLDFPAATALGLYVIGEDLLPGDVELQTPVATVATGAQETTLADGGQVFFLGVVESDPALAFGTAEVVSFAVEGVGDFAWNVDDIVTAPEVRGGAVALLALAAFSRRRAGARRSARAGSRPDR